MAISITINADTVAEAQRDLRQLLDGERGVVTWVATNEPPKPEPVAVTPKATRTKSEAKPEPTVDELVEATIAKAVDDSAKIAAAAKAEEARAKVEEAQAAAEANTFHGDGADEEIAVIDYETGIKPLILKLAESKGRGGVLAVLETFGVDNASKVPAINHAELRAALLAALEG